MSARAPRRPLGAFGEEVSALALGLGALARRDDSYAWERTVDAALDAGLTSIDAAAGDLRRPSEERLGALLEGRRDGLFLSTRAEREGRAALDVRPAELRANIEASLRALRTDRIDLYHVHDIEHADPKRLVDETLPTLVAARERGEVRYVGVSSRDTALLARVLQSYPVDAILAYGRLDLIDASLADEVLPAAREAGVAVINASPFHGGLLASVEAARAAGDERALAAFERARGLGADLPRAALRFARSFEGVATTVVGLASPAEVAAAVEAFTSETGGAEAELLSASTAR